MSTLNSFQHRVHPSCSIARDRFVCACALFPNFFLLFPRISLTGRSFSSAPECPLEIHFNTECPPPVQLLEIFLSVPVPFSPTFSYYFHVSLSPVGRLLLRHPQNRSNLSSSKSSQWKLSTLARGWRNWPRTSRACAGSAAAPASPLAVPTVTPRRRRTNACEQGNICQYCF